MTQDFDGQVRQLIGDQLSSMIEAAIVREMTSERLLAVLTSGSPPVGLPLIWRARQLVEGGRLQPRQLTATAERLFQAYLAERDPAKRRIETELKNLLPLLEPVTREGLARRMLSTARKSARRIAVRILVKDSPSDLADLLREAYSATHDKYVLGALAATTRRRATPSGGVPSRTRRRPDGSVPCLRIPACPGVRARLCDRTNLSTCLRPGGGPHTGWPLSRLCRGDPRGQPHTDWGVRTLRLGPVQDGRAVAVAPASGTIRLVRAAPVAAQRSLPRRRSWNSTPA